MTEREAGPGVGFPDLGWGKADTCPPSVKRERGVERGVERSPALCSPALRSPSSRRTHAHAHVSLCLRGWMGVGEGGGGGGSEEEGRGKEGKGGGGRERGGGRGEGRGGRREDRRRAQKKGENTNGRAPVVRLRSPKFYSSASPVMTWRVGMYVDVRT